MLQLRTPSRCAGSPPSPRGGRLCAAYATLRARVAMCATQVVLEAGYAEDHLISNVKIALGAAA